MKRFERIVNAVRMSCHFQRLWPCTCLSQAPPTQQQAGTSSTQRDERQVELGWTSSGTDSDTATDDDDNDEKAEQEAVEKRKAKLTEDSRWVTIFRDDFVSHKVECMDPRKQALVGIASSLFMLARRLLGVETSRLRTLTTVALYMGAAK